MVVAAPRSQLDLDGLVEADRVHRSLYLSPEIFDAEMHRIFERTWVFVAHKSEVPNPGDYKTTSIGRNPVIVTRDDAGEIHVLMNRCMHRGSIVCRDECGNAAAFRCGYHGWTYNSAGELVIVPGRGMYGPEFDQGELGLVQARRVASYRGFVFASLSPRGEDLPTYLGKARYYLDLVLDVSPRGEIELGFGVQKYWYQANWKFQLENWLDSYHAAITHETAFAVRERRAPAAQSRARSDAAGMEEDPYINTTFGRGHGTINAKQGANSAWARGAARHPEYLAALDERYGSERVQELTEESNLQLVVFPNLFFKMGDQELRVLRPVAVDRTVVYAYPYMLKGAPDDLNAHQINHLAWWSSAAGFGQPDDLEAWVRCQEGLQATGADWVLFARGIGQEWTEPDGEIVGRRTTEVPMRGIYREWQRLMSCEDDSL